MGKEGKEGEERRCDVIGWLDPFPSGWEGGAALSLASLVPSLRPGPGRTTFPILLWGPWSPPETSDGGLGCVQTQLRLRRPGSVGVIQAAVLADPGTAEAPER